MGDFARLAGSVRYGPSQTEESVTADLEALLAELRADFPGLETRVQKQFAGERPSMLPFEVASDATIVAATHAAYERLRGEPQPAARPWLGPGQPPRDQCELGGCAGLRSLAEPAKRQALSTTQ